MKDPTGAALGCSPHLSDAKEAARSRIAEDREDARADVAELLAVIAERLFEPGFDAARLLQLEAPDPETVFRFRRELGLELQAYIDQRRMDAAWELVSESALEVTVIARELGFESAELFSKWFKRRAGRAPAKLRGAPSRQRRRSASRTVDGFAWRQALLGSLGRDEYVSLVRSLTAQYPTARLPGGEEDSETLGDFRPDFPASLRESCGENVRKVLDDVLGNFRKPGYQVDGLRLALGESNRFYDRFRAEVGLPPWTLVQALRMERAVLLFRDTELKVPEVAWEVGYESPPAFQRLSKSWCGLAPGRLQKRLRRLAALGTPLPEGALAWHYLLRCRRSKLTDPEVRELMAYLEAVYESYGPVARESPVAVWEKTARERRNRREA